MTECKIDEIEPRFNKRRKIARRRSGNGDGNDEQDDVTALDHSPHGDAVQPRLAKQGRRNGVAFKAAARSSVTTEDSSAAPSSEDQSIELVKLGKFTRPIGQTVVAENRHMSAFIDARLNEISSSSDYNKPEAEANKAEEGQRDIKSLPSDANDINAQIVDRTQHPNPPVVKDNTRPTRRQRRRHEPSQADIDRDRLVEQILSEGARPRYHLSAEQPMSGPGNDTDRDLAAATAFKQDFLADLEERNHARRQPQISQNAAGGPKLGGSRSDREKMKASDENAKKAHG